MALIRGGGILCGFTGKQYLIINIRMKSCLVFVSFCPSYTLLHQPTEACSVLACFTANLLVDLLTCLQMDIRLDTV